MKKHWLRIVVIVVAVLVVIIIVLPFLIDVNSYRPKIESDASSALGRQVTVGNLGLSLLSGTVEADNVAVADDPAFSKSPFLTAKSLKIGVELMPLIFSKELKITEIVLEQPQITLLRTANGTWNYSTLGGPSAKKTEPKSGQAAPTNLSVGKLRVNDGRPLDGTSEFQSQPQGLQQAQHHSDGFFCHLAVSLHADREYPQRRSKFSGVKIVVGQLEAAFLLGN